MKQRHQRQGAQARKISQEPLNNCQAVATPLAMRERRRQAALACPLWPNEAG